MKETASSDSKRKGSMMVEACMVLPVFLFLILVMGAAFRMLHLEETILYHGFRQMEQCSVEMSLSYPTAKAGRLYLEHGIITKTKEELKEILGDRIRMIGVFDDGMWVTLHNWSGREKIHCGIFCSLELGDRGTMGFFSDELRFSGRSFGGEDQEAVWIFPNWGECYHKEDCTVTGGEKRRFVMDAAEEQGYRPCRICFQEGK